MSSSSMWDVGTGAGARSYLMRFDEGTNAWGAVTVQARLTVETNPLTKERAPAEIGNVQVTQTQPDAGLQVLRSTVAPDRMSVEVLVGASTRTDPTPGPHTFTIRLWPAAAPQDAGAAAAAAAGGIGGFPVVAGARIPTADVRFVVAVDPASRFVVDPKTAITLDSATGGPVRFSAAVEVRTNGQWAPQAGQAISATPEPTDGTLCWSAPDVPTTTGRLRRYCCRPDGKALRSRERRPPECRHPTGAHHDTELRRPAGHRHRDQRDNAPGDLQHEGRPHVDQPGARGAGGRDAHRRHRRSEAQLG